jgi:hypothetical protein
MNTPTPPRQTLIHHLWVALRFLVFGVGGLAILLGSTVAFGLFLSGANIPTISPWLSLPLTFAAALLMLFGTGKWGQWFYLLMFLWIPCALWMLIAASGPGSGKGDIFFPLIVIALVTCALMRGCEAARAKAPQAKRNEEPPGDEY